MSATAPFGRDELTLTFFLSLAPKRDICLASVKAGADLHLAGPLVPGAQRQAFANMQPSLIVVVSLLARLPPVDGAPGGAYALPLYRPTWLALS